MNAYEQSPSERPAAQPGIQQAIRTVVPPPQIGFPVFTQLLQSRVNIAHNPGVRKRETAAATSANGQLPEERAAPAHPQDSTRDYTFRALGLAFLVESVSCAGIFGDSFSRTTAEVLVNFHLALNLPVYVLFYILGIGSVLSVDNGCLRLAHPLPLLAIAAQCCIWTWFFLTLMRLERRLRSR
jgi:hypothetical protein